MPRNIQTVTGIDRESLRFALIDRKHLFSIPDREKENRGTACGLKMPPRLSTLAAQCLYIMLTIVYSAKTTNAESDRMLSPSRIAAMKFFSERVSLSDFPRAVDALPLPPSMRIAALATLLEVSPATVRAWYEGKRPPPRAAVIAVWHESHLGRCETAAHSEYGALLARQYADSLTDELRRAHATIAALTQELAALKLSGGNGPTAAMNDPAFSLCSPGTRPRLGAPCIPA